MGETEIRQEVPIWASLKLPERIGDDGTKEYRPKNSKDRKTATVRLRFNLTDFMKRRGIAVLLILSVVLYGWIVSAITEYRVTKRVTREVTAQVQSEMRAGFQKYLDNMEAERRKESFLTGEASMEAAAAELADWMDELIANYSMDYGITPDGCRTIGWVFLARCAKQSSEFGKTPQEIIEKNGAWEGKVAGHAVRNQDTQLALELARDYLAGRYPDGFTTELTFFNREPGGKIIARNELYTGPYTSYWWYGK